jgi:hypothetical protein
MVYDIRSHFPQVIEEMRQDIKAGNIEGLESNTMFASKILPEFEGVVKKSEEERNKKCFQAWKDYAKAINNAVNGLEIKELEDLTIDASLVYNKHMKALNDAEKDHWETVIANMIRYNQSEYKKLLKETNLP